MRPLSADAHRRHIVVYASCVLSLEGVGLVTLLKYMLQLISLATHMVYSVKIRLFKSHRDRILAHIAQCELIGDRLKSPQTFSRWLFSN